MLSSLPRCSLTKLLFIFIFGRILDLPFAGSESSGRSFLARIGVEPGRIFARAGKWQTSSSLGRFIFGKNSQIRMDDAPLPQRTQFKKRNTGAKNSGKSVDCNQSREPRQILIDVTKTPALDMDKYSCDLPESLVGPGSADLTLTNPSSHCNST